MSSREGNAAPRTSSASKNASIASIVVPRPIRRDLACICPAYSPTSDYLVRIPWILELRNKDDDIDGSPRHTKRWWTKPFHCTGPELNPHAKNQQSGRYQGVQGANRWLSSLASRRIRPSRQGWTTTPVSRQTECSWTIFTCCKAPHPATETLITQPGSLDRIHSTASGSCSRGCPC